MLLHERKTAIWNQISAESSHLLVRGDYFTGTHAHVLRAAYRFYSSSW